MADIRGIMKPYPFWAIIFLCDLYLFAFLHKCFITLLLGNIFLNNTDFCFLFNVDICLKEIALLTHSHINLIVLSSKLFINDIKHFRDIRFFVSSSSNGKYFLKFVIVIFRQFVKFGHGFIFLLYDKF